MQGPLLFYLFAPFSSILPPSFWPLSRATILIHLVQIQYVLVFICSLIKTCFAAFYSCTFLCKCIALILIVKFLPHPCCSIRVSLHPVCCSCLLQNTPVCFPCIFLVHTASGIHPPCFQLPNTTGLPETLACVPCVPVWEYICGKDSLLFISYIFWIALLTCFCIMDTFIPIYQKEKSKCFV